VKRLDSSSVPAHIGGRNLARALKGGNVRRNVDVEVIGAINDHKLKAKVTGYIDDSSGTGELEFKYSEVPPAPYWHPLNYTDPLVLLPGYAGGKGGVTFAKFAPPGTFTAECTLDFGNGLLLRKGATINVSTDGSFHTGGYFIAGTARSGHIPDVLGSKHGMPYEYREFMHPAGPGQIIGIGYATWPLGEQKGAPVEAVVSSRYRFAGSKAVLPGHYIRVVEIPEATWNPGTKVVTAKFNTRVEPLV
jgi:hypothetical protein